MLYIASLKAGGNGNCNYTFNPTTTCWHFFFDKCCLHFKTECRSTHICDTKPFQKCSPRWSRPNLIFTAASLLKEAEVTGLAEWWQTGGRSNGDCRCLLGDALVCEGYTLCQAKGVFTDRAALYSSLLLPMRNAFISQTCALGSFFYLFCLLFHLLFHCSVHLNS